MLLGGGRTAPQLPPDPLLPTGGLLPPAQPFVEIPAAPPPPPFPPVGSKKRPRRTRRRLCLGPPLAAGAANAHLGGPSEP